MTSMELDFCVVLYLMKSFIIGNTGPALEKCDQIWRNFVTSKKFFLIFKVYSLFCKILNQPLWQIFYAIGKIFVVVNHWQNNLSKHLGFELVSHNWGDAKETSFFLFFVFSFELCWQFNPIQFISLHQRKIYRRTPKTSKMPKTYILTTIFGPYSVNVWHPFRHALST